MNNAFEEQLKKIGEFGIVEQVQQSIAIVSGLPGAKMHEMVIFESGQVGSVFLLDRDSTEVLILSKEAIRPGIKVTRTDVPLSIPVGKELLGHIIDPLGNPISLTKEFIKPKESRVIDIQPPSMSSRATIKNPLVTGVTVIDMMIPLGKGQRELVIGDKKTGKTSFLLAALKSQAQLGTIGIYAAVGKKKTDIKFVQEFIEKEKLTDKIIVVASTSYDSPSLIFQTPYAAQAIGEYFADQGNDVMIVMDDLSTHAKFYREISLLAKRFPGRDAYPGDIFYTHGRLMERSGNYKRGDKEVSITCLPVVEIVEGDFAGYIATNLMGMTDGHIYFDANVFYKGRRPAVNTPLSVTRVGRQAQTKLLKNINNKLTTFLAEYEKLQGLAQFGAELTADARKKLKVGDILYKIFDQPAHLVIPVEIQLLLFGLAWLNIIEADGDKIAEYRSNFIKNYKFPNVKSFLAGLAKIEKFDDFINTVEKYKNELCKLGNITPVAQPQVSAPVAQPAPAQPQPNGTPASPPTAVS